MPKKKLTETPEFSELREGYYELNIGPAIITFRRIGDSGVCEVSVNPVGLGR